jgi:hypothetical protein
MLDPEVRLTTQGKYIIGKMQDMGILVDCGGHTGEQTSLDIINTICRLQWEAGTLLKKGESRYASSGSCNRRSSRDLLCRGNGRFGMARQRQRDVKSGRSCELRHRRGGRLRTRLAPQPVGTLRPLMRA